MNVCQDTRVIRLTRVNVRYNILYLFQLVFLYYFTFLLLISVLCFMKMHWQTESIFFIIIQSTFTRLLKKPKHSHPYND